MNSNMLLQFLVNVCTERVVIFNLEGHLSFTGDSDSWKLQCQLSLHLLGHNGVFLLLCCLPLIMQYMSSVRIQTGWKSYSPKQLLNAHVIKMSLSLEILIILYQCCTSDHQTNRLCSCITIPITPNSNNIQHCLTSDLWCLWGILAFPLFTVTESYFTDEKMYDTQLFPKVPLTKMCIRLCLSHTTPVFVLFC